MVALEKKRALVQEVLMEHTKVPYAHGQINIVPVFDAANDHYLVVLEGWNDRRVHGCLIHVDIHKDKIWIQRDGTEYGVAKELVDAGIPKDEIVLGFKDPEIRPHTGFAVA